MRRHIVPASLFLLGLGLLAGCGQKGPLFLPPTKPVATTPTTAASTAKPAAAATAPAAASSAH